MRRPRLVAASVALLLALSPTLSAWNATGHRLIAAIAYDRLNPKTRARVDDLIRRHPDYEKMFLQGAPTDPKARARLAHAPAAGLSRHGAAPGLALLRHSLRSGWRCD